METRRARRAAASPRPCEEAKGDAATLAAAANIEARLQLHERLHERMLSLAAARAREAEDADDEDDYEA